MDQLSDALAVTTIHIHLDQQQVAEKALYAIEDSELACSDWKPESQYQLAHEIAHALAPFVQVRRDPVRSCDTEERNP